MSVHLANTPVLSTERLTLRAPDAGDWPEWYAMMQSDRSSHIRDSEMTEAKAWRAFGHVIGHWVLRGWGNFVFTLQDCDTALGMAGPWYPAGWAEKEIGWSVWSAEAEGKGYAFEAAQAARAYAFDTLGWDTAVSYIAPDNARSIALAKRLGARPDRDAAVPDMPGAESTLVFRHPKPEAQG